MFGTTYVQVDGQPAFFNLRIKELPTVFRIGKSKVIPARAGPLRHGVGFPFEPCSVRSGGVKPVGGSFRQHRLRCPRWFEVGHFRQTDGQAGFGIGPHESRWLSVGIQFMPDRKRLAPITLTREEPVSQSIVDRLSSDPRRFEIAGNPGFEFQ